MYNVNSMIPNITNDHIRELLNVLDLVATEKDERTTKSYFKGELPELSQEAYWLFNFIMWLNKRPTADIRIAEEALFYHLPRNTKNISLFQDFVGIVKLYRKQKSVDKELVAFMTQLTKRYQTFYLNLITGFYKQNIQPKALTKYLDTSLIQAENIYSEVVQRDEVEFPAGVRFIPSGDLELVFLEKSTNNNGVYFNIYYPSNRELVREHLPKTFMKFDRKMIRLPTLFLYGFLDRVNEKFYPLDFFESKHEYKAASFGNLFTHYRERVQRLNEFLSSTILKGINSDPVVFAEKTLDVLEGLNPEIGTTGSRLVICDGVQRVNMIELTEVEGVIGGIAYDGDRPFGYQGWFNCEALPVVADLSGRNNAYILNFDLVKGKHMKFLLMETEGMRIGLLKEILWDKIPFRTFPLELNDGRKLFIEKCIVCARDDQHKDRGLCKPSEIMMHYFWKIYGPDNWFPIFTHKTKHRMLRTHWKETMINSVGYMFKGHMLIARAEDDGTYSAMFMSDEDAMKKHLEKLKKHGGANEFYTVNEKTGQVFNFNGSYARKTVRRNGCDEPLFDTESRASCDEQCS